MTSWEKVRYLVFRWRDVRDAVTVAQLGGLAKYGWLRSMREQASVDANGAPLPWITYPAIEFLSRRVPRDARVFEYGSGNGTLWWASRAQLVEACEHDPSWASRISARLPANARVTHVPLEVGGLYCRAVLASRQRFDIVMVDGRDRVNCVKHSVPTLTAGGVIILDNAERPEYSEVYLLLRSQGFRSIDFVGISPSSPDCTTTAVFYRNDNCLGI